MREVDILCLCEEEDYDLSFLEILVLFYILLGTRYPLFAFWLCYQIKDSPQE